MGLITSLILSWVKSVLSPFAPTFILVHNSSSLLWPGRESGECVGSPNVPYGVAEFASNHDPRIFFQHPRRTCSTVRLLIFQCVSGSFAGNSDTLQLHHLGTHFDIASFVHNFNELGMVEFGNIPDEVKLPAVGVRVGLFARNIVVVSQIDWTSGQFHRLRFNFECNCQLALHSVVRFVPINLKQPVSS